MVLVLHTITLQIGIKFNNHYKYKQNDVNILKIGVEFGTQGVKFVKMLASLVIPVYISIYLAGLSLDRFIDVWGGELEQCFNCILKITPNES